jgi:trimeric autotransporter adhesin
VRFVATPRLAAPPAPTNTATGAAALYKNTTGSYNTATGSDVLYRNRTGSSNTATGFDALSNNTASYNTATGWQALFSNTTSPLTPPWDTSHFKITPPTPETRPSVLAGFVITSLVFTTQRPALTLSITTPRLAAPPATTTPPTGVTALFNNTTGDNNTANGVISLYYNVNGAATRPMVIRRS